MNIPDLIQLQHRVITMMAAGHELTYSGENAWCLERYLDKPGENSIPGESIQKLKKQGVILLNA